MADEDKVSRRYRELPREEPPRHVDEAILAAARRAVEARPAPLVPPAGRRRWYFPLAAAAVIVLAVGVTVHVERAQRDLRVAEAPVQAPAPAREERAAAKPAPLLERRMQRDEARPAAAPEAVPGRAQEAAPAAARQQRAAAGTVVASAGESPEQWLERIAELRRQGRHEEADKALAEFRRAYPDYRIPEATLERVEKR
jgi:hypothetical protein